MASTSYGYVNMATRPLILSPIASIRSQFFAPVRCKQSTPTVGVLYSTAPSKGLDVALSALQMVRGKVPQFAYNLLWKPSAKKRIGAPKRCRIFLLPASRGNSKSLLAVRRLDHSQPKRGL